MATLERDGTTISRDESVITSQGRYLDTLSGQINSIQVSGHRDRIDELIERIEILEKQVKGKFYLDI